MGNRVPQGGMATTRRVIRSDRADTRLGGSWTASQRLKNDLLWTLANAALVATRPMPLDALRALGRTLGLAAYALAGESRRCALSNVARVFPDVTDAERIRLVRRCFVGLGEQLGEAVAMLRPEGTIPPFLPVTREAQDALVGVGASGRRSRGVLFASAHLGPWERVAASLVSCGVPLVALARESYDARFSSLYQRIRDRSGVRILWRGRPGAVSRILRTLRQGGVVGVPMDLRSRVASRLVPFLGVPAPTAVGPARIALMTGAAVVVGSAAPAADGSLVVTATPIPSIDLEPGEQGSLELTARINAEISRRILAIPHAWVWMHERWPQGGGTMTDGSGRSGSA
jgi:KDO2-lipid IV(A) lauroyltransferase